MDSNNNINEKIESGEKKVGLKLAGVDTDAMREQAKATEQEVWDFSEGDETQWLTTAKSAITRETEQNRFTDVGNIILIITQIVTYILVAVEIVTLAYITNLEPLFLVENITKYKGVFLICSAGLIIDAIVVNVLTETSLLLIVTAWLLPFVYPGARQLHVRGKSGIGVLVSIIYFLSLCGFLGFAGRQALNYGGVLTLKDGAVKAVAAAVIGQQVETGETIGEVFKDTFSIDDVKANKKGNSIVVTFIGNGTIYYSQEVFIRGIKKDVPTTLVFVRGENEKKYKLCEVTAGDMEFTEMGVDGYWSKMLK